MDGIDSDQSVIVLAATNFPDTLDKALTRKGRFDKQIPFELPDVYGREQILSVLSKEKPMSPDIDLM